MHHDVFRSSSVKRSKAVTGLASVHELPNEDEKVCFNDHLPLSQAQCACFSAAPKQSCAVGLTRPFRIIV